MKTKLQNDLAEGVAAKLREDGSLDETNYREFAKRAIDKYASKGMVIDAMLWRTIIKYYEDALVRKSAQ